MDGLSIKSVGVALLEGSAVGLLGYLAKIYLETRKKEKRPYIPFVITALMVCILLLYLSIPKQSISISEPLTNAKITVKKNNQNENHFIVKGLKKPTSDDYYAVVWVQPENKPEWYLQDSPKLSDSDGNFSVDAQIGDPDSPPDSGMEIKIMATLIDKQMNTALSQLVEEKGTLTESYPIGILYSKISTVTIEQVVQEVK